MKKVLFYLCLVGIVFILQGCPFLGAGPMQGHYDPVIGCASIFSPLDSVYVRSYDAAELPHEETLPPSNYLIGVSWYAEYSEDIPHSTEKHELHVRKLTNNEECIVIEGYGVYVNDTAWSLQTNFKDPADSIITYWNWDSLSYDTVIVHYKQCPYELSDVIEQLSMHYPNLVHGLNDTVEHNFSNHQIVGDRKNWPRIYLPTK
jgi:hypothetical protein